MCLIWRFCRAENTISYVLSTRAIGSNCSYPARLESFQVLTRKLSFFHRRGKMPQNWGHRLTIRRCARGSGRRREDAGPERRRFGQGTDFRPIGAGRAGRNTWHVAVETRSFCGGTPGVRCSAHGWGSRICCGRSLEPGRLAIRQVHMTSLSLRCLPKQAREVTAAPFMNSKRSPH